MTGEFEKRIKALVEIEEKHGAEYPQHIHNEKVLEIVDEMREDFPKKENYQRPTTPADHLPSGHGEILFDHGKYHKDIEDFYERWLK